MLTRLRAAMLTCAAMSLTAPAALAADIPAPMNNWTGFYFGAGGGGSFSFSETDASGASAYDSNTYSGDGYDYIENSGNLTGKGTFGSYGHSCYTDSNDDDYDCSSNFDTGTSASIGNGGEFGDLANSFYGVINDYLNDANEENDAGKAGAFATVEAGLDYQLGSRFVAGLNGSFNFGETSLKDSVAAGGESYLDVYADNYYDDVESYSRGASIGLLDADLELGNSWSVGGRMGFLVSDGLMLFGSGGYTATKATLKASYKSSVLANTVGEEDGNGEDGSAAGRVDMGLSSETDEWMNGFYVGGGMEAMLTENVSMKLEYRYSDLGTIKTSDSDEARQDNSYHDYYARVGVDAEANPITHAVRATVNYRF